MEPWLLLAIARHLALSQYLTLPSRFWVTFAADDEEIPGVERQPVTYAEPEVLTETAVRWASVEDVQFVNTPDAEADEVWVLDAEMGGNVWFRMPMVVTLVDGGSKTFRAGAIAHVIEDHSA